MGFEAMKPISRRSVIASLAALAVTFGLLLPQPHRRSQTRCPHGMTVPQSKQS